MIRVLIVEDDTDMGNLFAEQLEDLGCQVQNADNGAVALQSISGQMPDIIFVDIKMPVMDGFLFISELWGNPETSKIPVVVVTAMDIPEAMEKAEALGVKNIIAKPCDSHELYMMLGHALMPRGAWDIPAPGA